MNEGNEMANRENAALARNPFTCGECKQEMRKGFCSHCDEFYNMGHLSTCSSRKGRGQEGDHDSC